MKGALANTKNRHLFFFMKTLFFIFVINLSLARNVSADSLISSVPVTTNLIFELKKEFGPETNCFEAEERIGYALMAAGTNIVYYRALPSFSQAFEFNLFDDKGLNVPKTRRGLDDSEAPTSPNREELSEFKPQAVRYEPHLLFRPVDMFVITNSGVYIMEIRVRICVNITNGLPDYAAMKDPHRFVLNRTFGIITSPPVRVKILK